MAKKFRTKKRSFVYCSTNYRQVWYLVCMTVAFC